MQVRYVGEREVPERMSTEHLRTEERVIEETVTSPCSPLECNGCVPTGRGVAGNGVSILHTTPLAIALRCSCSSLRKSSLSKLNLCLLVYLLEVVRHGMAWRGCIGNGTQVLVAVLGLHCL